MASGLEYALPSRPAEEVVHVRRPRHRDHRLVEEELRRRRRERHRRANKTIKNIQGAWVSDHKVVVDKGKIVEWRVIMKVTFVLEK